MLRFFCPKNKDARLASVTSSLSMSVGRREDCNFGSQLVTLSTHRLVGRMAMSTASRRTQPMTMNEIIWSESVTNNDHCRCRDAMTTCVNLILFSHQSAAPTAGRTIPVTMAHNPMPTIFIPSYSESCIARSKKSARIGDILCAISPWCPLSTQR